MKRKRKHGKGGKNIENEILKFFWVKTKYQFTVILTLLMNTALISKEIYLFQVIVLSSSILNRVFDCLDKNPATTFMGSLEPQITNTQKIQESKPNAS